MEFQFRKAKWIEDCEGAWLMLLVPDKKAVQEFVASLSDTIYRCVIKLFKPKRSLNANNYSWALSDQLADALRISKEECHFLMLKRYGQKTVVSVIEEGIPILEKAVDYFEQYAQSEMNGKTFYHYKVWKGSHEFDTKEMAIFIDGIVSECKEQGIPTETPDEIARIKSAWGKER
jgi:hypothetical protein